ncbi:hypothetical protein G5V57_00575 [Nordella sp. HKS 07]|nr:hypothetical protein G5V57_00575 [Nordella sp. HKS 07]
MWLGLRGQRLHGHKFTRQHSLDHDEFGLNQPKLINVIDSYMLARDSCEKPVSTFSHPALAKLPPD